MGKRRARFASGVYDVINRKKYKNRKKLPRYRSSWERKFMVWCDHSDKVVSWDYENLEIPYRYSVDQKIHRYILDFMVDVIENGKVVRYAIEVKPVDQLLPPERKKFRSKIKYVEAAKVYIQNRDKREATQALCRKKGWKYKAITEYDLFGQKKK